MTDLTRIRRHLHQLPQDQLTIELQLATWHTQPTTPSNGDPAVGPLPGGTQLLSTATDLAPHGFIHTALLEWRDDWRERRRMDPEPPALLAHICAWLWTHAAWAVDHHPAVNDFADELAHHATTVHRAVTDTDRWARTRLACWALTGEPPDRTPCGNTLWIDRLDPASPLLVCRTCQATWTPEGLGDLRDRPIAIHDASALTGLSEKLLRHAVHRGRIPAHRDGNRIRVVLADVWRWRISA